MTETCKRFCLFGISLVLQGLGIAITSLSSAGTTPINSLPLETAVHSGLTVGQTTVIINALFILGQYLLTEQPKRNSRENFIFLGLQIPAVFVFGLSIDANMIVINWIVPEALNQYYVMDIVKVLLGSWFIAFSICLQVIASAAMVPGEGLVRAISRRLNKEFGKVKLFFDLTLVSSAIIVGLLATGFSYVSGVREGTVISALIIGPMVLYMMPHLKFIEGYLVVKGLTQEIDAQTVTAASSPYSRVITISREYGSGGKHIAQEVAKRLGLQCYDKDLVEMIAKESGFSESFVEDNDSKMESSLLFEMVFQDFTSKIEQSMSSKDALFVATSRVIRRLATEKPCVIVGRASDQILKDDPNVLSFHITASLEYKINFCQRNYNIIQDKAIERMKDIDRQRAEYYRHYTGQDISDSSNYDACFSVSSLGEQRVIDLICSLYQEHAKETAQKAA